MPRMALALLVILSFARPDPAQTAHVANPRVESNAFYGMYSGLALLMDVHSPESANGYGIILVPGTGFHAPLAYDAPPAKESLAVAIYATPLVKAGYTVFVVNYRVAPRFRYPAAIEDVQRAVRYIMSVRTLRPFF